MMRTAMLMLSTTVCAFTWHQRANAQDALPQMQQQLAAVKAAIAQNQTALLQYTWTEQNVVTVKGEIMKNATWQCRYGSDGTVSKTLVANALPNQKKDGGLDKEVEQVVQLVRQYVPPSSQSMQSAMDVANATFNQNGPLLQIQFTNLVKSADSAVMVFNTDANTIRELNVNTYLYLQGDPTTLQVNFQAVSGGPNCVAQTTISTPSKHLQVQTTNSNWQKIAK